MKKKIGLILCGVLVICCFFGCRKTYNLNEYTEYEVIEDKVDANLNVKKSLYDRIKEGSIITYKGVVLSTERGYDENGNTIYFYKIQPIYKGSNLKHTVERYSGFSKGLMVLSPFEEVNKDILKFHDYLKRGDVVNVKGRKVKCGEYYKSEEYIGENEENYKWNYIKAEEIEFIGNADEILENNNDDDDDDNNDDDDYYDDDL